MTFHDEIISKLFRQSPFMDFDESAFTLDLQGWGSTEPIFEEAVKNITPSIVLEVGSWKGASAVHLARLIPEASVLICIDTWLGTINNFLGRDGLSGDSLKRRNGYPEIYFQFLANVKLSQLHHKIVPLPQTSNNGFAILKMMDVRPDLVYIDGSHEFDDVVDDLKNAHSLLTDNGVIIGDDFSREGVREAVYAAMRDCCSEAQISGEKFVMFKKQTYHFSGFSPIPRRKPSLLKRVAKALHI